MKDANPFLFSCTRIRNHISSLYTYEKAWIFFRHLLVSMSTFALTGMIFPHSKIVQDYKYWCFILGLLKTESIGWIICIFFLSITHFLCVFYVFASVFLLKGKGHWFCNFAQIAETLITIIFKIDPSLILILEARNLAGLQNSLSIMSRLTKWMTMRNSTSILHIPTLHSKAKYMY